MALDQDSFPHGISSVGFKRFTGPTLVLGGAWRHEHLSVCDLSHIRGLVVREEGVKLPWSSLNIESAIRDLANLVYIDIEYSKIDSLEWLCSVAPTIEILSIQAGQLSSGAPCTLSAPNLRIIDIPDKKQLIGLIRNENISEARISGYRESDLVPIQFLRAVRDLKLIRAKKITSLSGIARLTKLKHLHVYGAPNLNDIAEVFDSRSLESVFFQSCSGILPPSSDGPRAAIRGVKFLDCKRLQSIQWLKRLKDIEQVFVSGTVIEDGKVSFLRELGTLKEVFVQRHRSYDGRFDQETSG